MPQIKSHVSAWAIQMSDLRYSQIEWSQAQADSDAHFKRAKIQRANMTEEFLASKCDIFSSSDFYYYAEQTGKQIEWIMKNANFETELADILHYAELDDDNELIHLIIHHLL